jgi:hypothetical protein
VHRATRRERHALAQARRRHPGGEIHIHAAELLHEELTAAGRTSVPGNHSAHRTLSDAVSDKALTTQRKHHVRTNAEMSQGRFNTN